MPARLLILVPAALVVFALACGAGSTPGATEEAPAPPGISPVVPATRVASLRPTQTPTPLLRPASTALPSIGSQNNPSQSCVSPLPGAIPTASSSLAASPEAIGTAVPPVFGRLQSPRDVPTPEPVQPLSMRPDEALERQLRDVVGAELDGYAVAALDLKTGRGVSINGGDSFYAASIFKVWVMVEVYHQAALGLFSLDDELVMTAYYDAFGLGPRATALCEQLSVRQLLEAMMSVSDNAAAVLLQDLVGAPNINSALETYGLKDSRLTTEDIPLTADDSLLLLQLIATGETVSREASADMAALMLMETFDNGLAAALPEGAEAAHKTGNWSGARHDIAIVYGEDSTYVVALLSDGRSGSYATIEALSKAIYDAFNG